MPMTRALGIIRLSKSPDPASTSVDRQRDIITEYAHRENMELVGFAEDLATSAFKIPPEKRKAIKEWLDQPEEYDCLVYWRQDRIVRRVRDFMGLVTWCQGHNKKLYSATEGLGDVTQHSGLLLGFINAWQAEGESRNTSTRVGGSRQKLVKEDRWPGGRPAYGFKAVKKNPAPGFELIPDEKDTAPVVREAARRVIAGESTNAVAIDFNNRGMRAADGGMWHPPVLRKILRNAILTEGIITAQEFGQLQLALDQRSMQRTIRTQGHDSLILDVVFCSCGGKRYLWKREPDSKRHSKEKWYARCRNEMKRGLTDTYCREPMVPYDFLEAAITDDMLLHHGDWLIETRVTSTTRRSRADEIDRELLGLSAEFTARRIDRAEFTKRQGELLDEQEALMGNSPAVPEWAPTGETVAQLWERLSNAERRLWLLRIGAIWIVRRIHTEPAVGGGHARHTWQVRRWERADNDELRRERIVRPH